MVLMNLFSGKQWRQRHREQSCSSLQGHSGGSREWDELTEWHGMMFNSQFCNDIRNQASFQMLSCHLCVSLMRYLFRPFVAVAVVYLLSHVWLFVTPGTETRQTSLSVGFSRQKYWSGLPFPTPGIFPTQELNLDLLQVLCVAGRFFTTEPLGKSCLDLWPIFKSDCFLIIEYLKKCSLHIFDTSPF